MTTDTSLKFGPEWLRALTEPQQGTVNYTPPLPNMKLADYRYGREEMLALFDKDVLPPDDLLSLGTLFVEKCQFPLNLIQVGEEETRAWQKGANSDASLRPFGVHGKRPVSPNRGRGKGRGGAAYPHYERNRSLEEDMELGRVRIDREDRGYSHGRGRVGGLDRATERGWLEPGEKPGRDDGDTALRKGYTKAPSDDWRGLRDGFKTKEDGWRSVPSSRGWNPPSDSWRNNERVAEFGKPAVEEGKTFDRWRKEERNPGGMRTGFVNRYNRDAENLPEWVTETQTEDSEGCFDDSGKFKAEHLSSSKAFPANDKWGEDEKWEEEEEIDPDGILAPASSEPVKANLPKENRPSREPPSTLASEINQNSGNHQQDDMDTIAGNLVAALVDEQDEKPHQESLDLPPGGLGIAGLNLTTWTYLDPQGQVQGPFKSEEMLEWCSAGYFPHDLMIKRNIDFKFSSLSEMSKLYSKNPFIPGPAPPPINNTDVEEQFKQQQLLQLHQLYLQQQHQQQLMAQQQLLMMQQQQAPDLTRYFHNPVNILGDPLSNLLMNLNKPPEPIVEKNHIKTVADMGLVGPSPDLIFRNNSPLSTHIVPPVEPEHNSSNSNNFDAIQSLLHQLQAKSAREVQQDSPVPQVNHMNHLAPSLSPPHTRHVLDNNPEDWADYSEKSDPLHSNQETHSPTPQLPSTPCTAFQPEDDPSPQFLEEEKDASFFQKPKSSEKSEKKKKKAEEKRKAKTKTEEEVSPYIPGMPGSVPTARPSISQQAEDEQVTRVEQMTGESSASLESRRAEEMARKEKMAKPAPWAKKTEEYREQVVSSLSLQDIQKLEAEKERIEKAARELADAESREERRRKDEEERLRKLSKQANWSAVIAPSATHVKSLAEIQEEEAKSEREKLDKEVKEKSRRAKDLGIKSSNWNGKQNTSWAGKIAASTPVPPPVNKNIITNPQPPSNKERVNIVAPDGFWDPVVNKPASKPTVTPANKKKKKPAVEDAVNEITRQFDDWCRMSLESLNAQVDIPTFLSFLRDIESPYEVHDYVKSYVGDGKAQKKFAIDYLEKRSYWKNAKRRGSKYEDDLTTPALAISPGDGDFQEANRKGKKKSKNSKSNLNHLLGFSIQGQGVNRGELDIPQ